MADVTIIARPVTEGTRHALVLTEDRLGHYPEFRAFFVRTFDLDRVGLSEPGFLRAPSGMAYALVFVGRSGEAFPSGLEVYAIVEALEPLDETVVDKDLWAILGWMIGGVGVPWTVEDLHATGQLYRIPAAGSPDPVGTTRKISHETVWHAFGTVTHARYICEGRNDIMSNVFVSIPAAPFLTGIPVCGRRLPRLARGTVSNATGPGSPTNSAAAPSN